MCANIIHLGINRIIIFVFTLTAAFTDFWPFAFSRTETSDTWRTATGERCDRLHSCDRRHTPSDVWWISASTPALTRQQSNWTVSSTGQDAVTSLADVVTGHSLKQTGQRDATVCFCEYFFSSSELLNLSEKKYRCVYLQDIFVHIQVIKIRVRVGPQTVRSVFSVGLRRIQVTCSTRKMSQHATQTWEGEETASPPDRPCPITSGP